MPVVGPADSKPHVVGDAREVHGQVAQRRREEDRVLHGLHRLEQVIALVKRDAAERRQLGHHARVILRMRVQAGAGRRPADAQPPQPLGREFDLVAAALDGGRPGADFLPQANRHGVLQVRPPALDHIVPLGRLAARHADEARQRLQQLVQPPERAQPYRGRDGVIGRLRHVDVVVGMHRLVRRVHRVTEQLIGAVGHHLVGVHVVAGARARLKGIDHEVLVMLPGQDFLARLR